MDPHEQDATQAVEPSPSDLPEGARPCPDCGSAETRLSKRSGMVVALFAMLNMSRYKCRACGRRFYAGN